MLRRKSLLAALGLAVLAGLLPDRSLGWEKRKVPQSQPWFDVFEIRPQTFLIHEPGHPERVISYLLVGNERALLFDTGLGIGDIRKVVEELTDLEVIVLNSHSHPDHVGGNHAFPKIYGLDHEVIHRASQGLGRKVSKQVLRADRVSRPWPAGFSPARYRLRPFQVSHTVTDGEIIDLGGRPLEVLLTPGHSADSLCLLDRRDRLLLTGDTFYLGNLFALAPTADLKDYAASAKRLAELAGDLEALLPAHSATLLDPSYLVRLHEAFQTLDKATFRRTRGNYRQYVFGDFSLLTRPDEP